MDNAELMVLWSQAQAMGPAGLDWYKQQTGYATYAAAVEAQGTAPWQTHIPETIPAGYEVQAGTIVAHEANGGSASHVMDASLPIIEVPEPLPLPLAQQTMAEGVEVSESQWAQLLGLGLGLLGGVVGGTAGVLLGGAAGYFLGQDGGAAPATTTTALTTTNGGAIVETALLNTGGVPLVGPGVLEPPAQYVTKRWNTRVYSDKDRGYIKIEFYKLINGRILSINTATNEYKCWKPKKHIVLSKDPRMSQIAKLERVYHKTIRKLARKSKDLKLAK